jgi:2-iminobutanoate/2-iminopropanoate deaminase
MPATPVPTPSAPPVAGPYSPAVRAGDWLILSGQVGFDPATGLMAEGIEAQTQKVMENIAAILIDCGASITDVAKTLVFVTDLSDFAVVNQIYGEAMGDHRPARSTVQVAGLPGGALVEIETWVYAPAG